MLRELVSFFDEQRVRDLEGLRRWAVSSEFKRDFEGRVKGLGPTVYNRLVMRPGVETVKPPGGGHLRRFVETTLARRVSDGEIVAGISETARQLGKKSYELDWSIWEYQRSAGRR